MIDQSQTSNRKTLSDLIDAISSQGLDYGTSLSTSQEQNQMDLFGQPAVPARPSVRLAKKDAAQNAANERLCRALLQRLCLHAPYADTLGTPTADIFIRNSDAWLRAE